MTENFEQRYKERMGGAAPTMTAAAMRCFDRDAQLHLAAGGDYRLLLLAAGTAMYEAAVLAAGSGILLAPGQTVLCEFAKDAVLCSVGFQGADAARLLEPLLRRKQPQPFTAAESMTLAAAVSKAAALPEGCSPALYRCGLLFEMFACLPLQQETETEDFGKQAMDFIRAHYMQPIGVNDVADAVGVSRSWLYRCFMEYAAQSPAMYLRDLRLQRAKSLLQRTSMSVQEIARAVGYEDPLYFSRVFSAYEGCSPTTYRKNSP